MISIKNATKCYITCLYLETLIFWAMGTASHYEFWVFPGSKTWGEGVMVIQDIILSHCTKFQLVTNFL